MARQSCFIIMPITTPADLLPSYADDAEHFVHVLDYLFVPAVEDAGYEPIRPMTEGSSIIHADIVGNLEKADMVLCDASILNANVFFEFGIRTALNRPVCLVKDDKTLKVPFDTGMINHHTYDSDLSSWVVKPEIRKLSKHLTDTAAKAGGENALWKHFGIARHAEPTSVDNPLESKVDLILSKIIKDEARKEEGRVVALDMWEEVPAPMSLHDPNLDAQIQKPVYRPGSRNRRLFVRNVEDLAATEGLRVENVSEVGNALQIILAGVPSTDMLAKVRTTAERMDIPYRLLYPVEGKLHVVGNELTR